MMNTARIIILFQLIIFSVFSYAQAVGSKVSFTAVDGKAYTGTVTEIKEGQSKVKYDNYDFEAWLYNSTLTVMDTGNQPQVPQRKTGGDWQVGDKVEVQDMYKNYTWEEATIKVVHADYNPKTYTASLDNPAGHAITDLLLTASQIRARGTRAAVFAVGTHVDAFYNDHTPHGKATVIADKGNGRYRIHFDGCGNHFDDDVDWSQLAPVSTVSNTHPDITGVFGKWAMFVYSYPNTVISGNNVYREYGPGAKAPPLQINANGTYIWYDEYNKPPVKGNWATDAKIQGLTMGTDSYNGILVTDSHGITWKIHLDRPDHIEARKLCSGETEGGSRLK
jgi:hypothetical protein